MEQKRESQDAALTERRERRTILRDFGQEIVAHYRLSIGFGLFWTWVWLVFQTTFFSPAFLLESTMPLPGWIIPLSAYAVTFLATHRGAPGICA